MNRWKSRKFIMAAVSAAIVLVKGLGIINLDDDSIWQMVAIILGWIGIEGAVDFVRALRNYTVVLEEGDGEEEETR